MTKTMKKHFDNRGDFPYFYLCGLKAVVNFNIKFQLNKQLVFPLTCFMLNSSFKSSAGEKPTRKL